MTPEQRQAVVDEARSWLRTPYINCGDVKGVGVDCAMLLVRVYCDLGLVPAFDPRPYSPDWFLHRDEEKYLGWIKDYAEPVDDPQPGDVVLFKFGRTVSHGGIVVAPDLMIHAYRSSGNVELCEISSLAERLAGFWRVRP